MHAYRRYDFIKAQKVKVKKANLTNATRKLIAFKNGIVSKSNGNLLIKYIIRKTKKAILGHLKIS
jgi:hypothetical protein